MAFTSVSGRVALVTGAARGIGKAIATALLEEGAPVAVCDIDEIALARTAEELAGIGGRTKPYVLDVTDSAAFSQVITRVEHDLGPIDILVNNAGIMPVGPFLDLPTATDRRQVEINVFGVINGMRAVLPRMERRHRGHIVNLASVAGKIPAPYAAVYTATKHAVAGLTEAVRWEMQGHGIDFTYVMPAFVDTELISGAGVPRWPPVATPQDVAAGVLRGIRKGKVDVYVPRVARIAPILSVVTPRAFYERVARLLKADRVFEQVDETARANYRQRVPEV